VLYERGVGVALVSRAEPAQAKIESLAAHGDMPHGGDGFGGQHAGAIQLAVAQVHPQEAGRVADRPHQAAVGGAVQQEPAQRKPAAGRVADHPAR
jgi:hypothetical protein